MFSFSIQSFKADIEWLITPNLGREGNEESTKGTKCGGSWGKARLRPLRRQGPVPEGARRL